MEELSNKQVMHNLSEICKKVGYKRNGDSGNCGNFALALARELHKIDIPSDIVICSDLAVNDDTEIIDYEDYESSMYHVVLMVNNKLYDSLGESSIQKLQKIALDQYGDNNPSITAWRYTPENDDKFRYIFEWGTDFNTYPEYFQKSFKNYLKGFKEVNNGNI